MKAKLIEKIVTIATKRRNHFSPYALNPTKGYRKFKVAYLKELLTAFEIADRLLSESEEVLSRYDVDSYKGVRSMMPAEVVEALEKDLTAAKIFVSGKV